MLRLQAPLAERYTEPTRRGSGRAHRRGQGRLGDRLFILGHHYQRDEVMRWADARGDSFRLSVAGQGAPRGRLHRVLRRALHGRGRRHPDRRPPAGDPPRPERRLLDGRHGRHRLRRGGVGGAGRGDRHRPGRADHLHELGRQPEGLRRPTRRSRVHLDQRPSGARVGAQRPDGPGASRCCSSPTSTWAATPATRWATPRPTCGCGTRASSWAASPRPTCKEATFLLWKGHCSVHQRFQPATTSRPSGPSTPTASSSSPRVRARGVRDRRPGRLDRLHHPGRRRRARPAPVIGVGTEIHLVQRLDAETPTRRRLARPAVCPCSTMFRIDAPHLAWTLEQLVEGKVTNRITVDPDTAHWARVALERMLSIT